MNWEAGHLIRNLGIYLHVKDQTYDELREIDCVGFANYYLYNCYDKSEMTNKANVAIYKHLLDIDAKLGTSQTEQLFQCVKNTVRMDLIKV